MNQNELKDDYSPLENLILTQTFDLDSIQRHSEAMRQYLIAYSGSDARQQLTAGLSQIAESRIHPDYVKQNLKQQAGYSAEIKYVADRNAEAILQGDPNRYVRTDDLPGHYNDPIFDHVQVNEQGHVMWETGEQMKFIKMKFFWEKEGQKQFVEADGEKWLDKMISDSDFHKYFEHDATLTCPSDGYEVILKAADKKIEKLQSQIDRLNADGKFDIAASKQLEIDKTIQLKNNLKDSGITSTEAMLARLSPTVSTAIDMAKIGHQAGLSQLKNGTWAIVASGMSIYKNALAYFNDEKTLMQALGSVGVDVVKAGGATYGLAFGTSTIGATLSNSANSTLQSIGSSTWAPAFLALTALEAGKSLNKLRKGEITPSECFSELTEKTVVVAGAQLGAAIGQGLIPIPIVGAMIGSVVGSVIATYVVGGCKAMYYDIKTIDAQVERAHERSLAIQAQCAEAIRQIRYQRMQMQMLAAQYMSGFMQTFNQSFDLMKESILTDNIDMFIYANNLIVEKCGGQIQYRTMKEFDDFMNSNQSFKL
jgi:hypothetical protein